MKRRLLKAVIGLAVLGMLAGCSNTSPGVEAKSDQAEEKGRDFLEKKTDKVSNKKQEDGSKEQAAQKEDRKAAEGKEPSQEIAQAVWQIEEDGNSLNYKVGVKINDQAALQLTEVEGEYHQEVTEEMEGIEGCMKGMEVFNDGQTTYLCMACPDQETLQLWRKYVPAEGEEEPFSLLRQVSYNKETSRWEVERPDFQAAVVSDFVLGGSLYGHWVQGSDLKDFIEKNQQFELYSDQQKPLGTYSGSLHHEPGFPDTIMANLEGAPSYQVALTGASWDPFPQKMEVLSNDAAVYKKIVSDYLKKLGLTVNDPNITQAYRVDLEGNGTDEVLICATNMDFDAPTGKSEYGDYCVLFLRKIVDDEVKTIPFFSLANTQHVTDEDFEAGNYDIQFVEKIISCMDVNGDGKLEILLGWRYYEGMIYSAYEVKGEQVKEIFSGGIMI